MGCRGRGKFPFPCLISVEVMAVGHRLDGQHVAVESRQREACEEDDVAVFFHRQQPDALVPQHLAKKDGLVVLSLHFLEGQGGTIMVHYGFTGAALLRGTSPPYLLKAGKIRAGHPERK